MGGYGRVKHFTCERSFRGKPITAEVTVTDNGIQIGLYGGDKPHIGAVGIVGPTGQLTVTQFEMHKEGVLCRQWCETLAGAGCFPAVVTAGIHYDGISKSEILQVTVQCTAMLNEMITTLGCKSEQKSD